MMKSATLDAPVAGVAAPRIRRSIVASTAIVMGASALSAIIGFVREIVTAHLYGTRSEVDAYVNASTIPLMLFGVFNGSLVGALVPTFSDYISTGRTEEARRLGSTIFNVVLVVITVLAALGWLLAPVLVPIVAHGFPPAKQELEVGMLRILMPGIIGTTMSGVCAAILNANHKFAASAFVTVVANVVTLTCMVIFAPHFGIYALVVGGLLGLLAQVAIQIPPLIKNGLYRLELDLHHPGLAKAWALFVPVTAGSGAWQINLACDRYFASTLDAGSTAALAYTTKVAFLPILVVATAISTVVFPVVAGQFANGDRDGMRRSIAHALGLVSFIVLPCAAGLAALARPIVETLFERGAFTTASTIYCASLMPFACIQLIAIAYSVVMARVCYACKEMRMAVTSYFVVVGLNIVLSISLLPHLGARGLLLANGLAIFAGVVFLIRSLRRLTGGMDWKPFLSSFWRTTVASLAMAAVLAWIRFSGVIPPPHGAMRVALLAVLLLIGALTYIGVCRLLKVEELGTVLEAIGRKLRRAPEADVAREQIA